MCYIFDSQKTNVQSRVEGREKDTRSEQPRSDDVIVGTAHGRTKGAKGGAALSIILQQSQTETRATELEGAVEWNYVHGAEWSRRRRRAGDRVGA